MNNPERYRDKYRIESTRLQHWDYRWSAAYLITICTQNRNHYFGKILNNEMILSPIGAIADVLWYELPNRNKHVRLGKYVIMPNHVHMILILQNDNDIADGGDGVGGVDCRDRACPVSTLPHTLSPLHPPQSPQTIGQQRFQNIGKHSVSSIIGGYKSAVTKHAHRLGIDFKWQASFHDHIIRDEAAYNKISQYISNNPLVWTQDCFFEAE